MNKQLIAQLAPWILVVLLSVSVATELAINRKLVRKMTELSYRLDHCQICDGMMDSE